MPETFAAQVAAVVAAQDYGRASAAKRGRNPAFPYVPVVERAGRTQNPAHRTAFATRAEAVAFAERQVANAREHFAAQLASPGCRSLREAYGLPREVPAA